MSVIGVLRGARYIGWSFEPSRGPVAPSAKEGPLLGKLPETSTSSFCLADRYHISHKRTVALICLTRYHLLLLKHLCAAAP